MALNLRRLGFCGVDNSVNQKHLLLLSKHYPQIEWGVLFRADKEGEPRYPTYDWVVSLCNLNANSGSGMHLAGHLCGQRCQEVVEGQSAFVAELYTLGFRRVQINATAANNVTIDKSKSQFYADNIRSVINAVPGIEFIIQCNPETKHIVDLLEADPASNMSFLVDASCGKGVAISLDTMPPPHAKIPTGYAGGIGPCTIDSTLAAVQGKAGGAAVWVDMESRIRSFTADSPADTPKDVFSLDKCFECIEVALKYGLQEAK